MIFVVLILIAVVLVILFVSGFITYNISFNRYKIMEKKENDENKSLDGKVLDTKWFSKNVKTVNIISKDKLNLKGYVINNNYDKWMIIVHGYTSSHIPYVNVAKKFNEMKYNILLLDLRAHGRSEGKYITMGVKDAFDLKNWINYIINEYCAKEIGLYGVSMGAATIMTASGLNLASEVKYLIEDCGYTSVKDEMIYQIKSTFHLPPFPFYNISCFYARLLAKYSYTKYSPVKSLRKNTIPILMIHGQDDKYVPFYMLDILYNSCNSYKEKLIVKNAKHAQSLFVSPNVYWNTVEEFLNNVKKRG